VYSGEATRGQILSCNFSGGAGFLGATAIITMKTLLSILSILLLTAAAMSLDTYRLDAGDWSMAAIVAVLFGFALNDVRRRERRCGRPV